LWLFRRHGVASVRQHGLRQAVAEHGFKT
jgi:hypothetical protein